MGLLSIFKRRADPSANATGTVGESADPVQRARTRARQRLIGAVVLVGIGIIGFPLVFETQPRPIPVDIPIEVPRKEAAPALAMPAGRTAVVAAAATPPAAASQASASASASNDVITESREEAGRNAVPIFEATRATSLPKAAAEPKPALPAAEGARAKALLEAKPMAAPESGRFVVQVGAFADAGTAHETRLKVEKLGLKTYTQVANTAAGSRIRVRVGPFTTREEADKALAKARANGLTAVVLTL